MYKTKKLSFYEVNPRYFKDNSGNGVGDLKGLSNKFDYFGYLGTDVLIFQDLLSSDIKGEVQSFKKVASDIGSENDFVKIISQAKKSNIKIVIELKLGTISSNSEWFKSAQNPKVNEFSNIVDFKNKAEEAEGVDYQYSEEAQKYYPVDTKTQEVNLNWKSEQVLEHFISVIKFWNELGIDGFAFKDFEYAADTSKEVAMSENTLKELRKLYKTIKQINENLMIIGKTDELGPEFSNSLTDGATKIFDYFMSSFVSSIGLSKVFGKDALGKFSAKSLANTLKYYSHNEKNILSLDSRNYGRVLSRWLDDHQYQKESAKTLGMLLMLNKASSSIYCGNEIGATNIGLTHLDDFQDKTLEARRTAVMSKKVSEKEFMDAQVLQGSINAKSLMAWTSDNSGGFSIAQKTVVPVSVNYKEINVANQFKEEKSVLKFYKELKRIATSSIYANLINEGTQKISSLKPGLLKSKISEGASEIIVYANLTNSIKTIKKFNEGRVVLTSIEAKKYDEVPRKLDAYETIMIVKGIGEYSKDTGSETENTEKATTKDVPKKEVEETQVISEHEKLQREKQEALASLGATESQTSADIARVKEEITPEPVVEKVEPKPAPKKINFDELSESEKRKKIAEARIAKMKAEEARDKAIQESQKSDSIVKTTSDQDEEQEEDEEIARAKAAIKMQNAVSEEHRSEGTNLKESEIAKTTIIEEDFDLDDIFGEDK